MVPRLSPRNRFQLLFHSTAPFQVTEVRIDVKSCLFLLLQSTLQKSESMPNPVYFCFIVCFRLHFVFFSTCFVSIRSLFLQGFRTQKEQFKKMRRKDYFCMDSGLRKNSSKNEEKRLDFCTLISSAERLTR
jgi:hypothetical protein